MVNQCCSKGNWQPLNRNVRLPQHNDLLEIYRILKIDTPTLKRGGILGSTKPLKLDSLRRLAQRWDSPQALLSECPSVVALLQVLFKFGLLQKSDSSSPYESFTYC